MSAKNSIVRTAAILTWFVGFTFSTGIMIADAAEDLVTVQLKWVHQAQFAGFYVALEKGFYADEGLAVALIPGGNNVDLARSLIDGTADVAVLAPEDIIIQRSRGLQLKAIAAIYRRSAVVYLSMPGSGIHRPSDFMGKTIAASGPHGSVRDFEIQLAAMMKILGLDMAQVHLVPYDPAYVGFLKGEVDVTAAYTTGGLIKIRSQGVSPNIIWPGGYRVRFYSATLAATDRTIAEHPEKIRRFLRATLKGWQTAIGNPSGTVDIVLKYAMIKDRALQTAMFDVLLPLVHTGEDSIGWMHAEAWHEMHRVLSEQGIVQKPLDPVEQIYTMQFLESLKGDKTP